MSKFNRVEQKILGKLQQIFTSPRRVQTMKFLMDKFAFDSKKASDLYTLWFLNYQEDGDYSKVENVNRDIRPVLTILKQIQSGELEEEDIPEIYYVEPISFCQGSSYYQSESLPCISLDSDEVILKMDRDQWEQPNISGLHEEDLWKYYEAFDNYGSSYYEEYEDEEFNYATFTDKSLEFISQIALHSNRRDIVDYLSGSNVEGEEVVKYLADLLPKNDFDDIKDEWLADVGYETTRMRNIEGRKYYEEEIKYDVSRGGGEYEIEIPMDEFIELVEEHNPLDFAGFLEMEINPEVDLESGYYDTGYYNSDFTDHIDNMDNKLEKLAEEYSDGSLEEYHSKLQGFRKLLDDVGIKITDNHYRLGNIYTSKDSRLTFNEGGINILEDKIRFEYDGEPHIIPLKNFINWAQGSILDLKYESVRYGKIPLMEGKQTYTKLSIFDFDGTLADTPDQEDGVPIWEAKTGKEYPHKGWWSKRESLDTDVFNIKLNRKVIMDYSAESVENNTLIVLMTGRMDNQADQVETILNEKSVVFDEYHYKERGDTLTSKINSIKRILQKNPTISKIEMWEDRLNHADSFEEWGNENGIDVKVNRVSV